MNMITISTLCGEITLDITRIKEVLKKNLR